MFNFYPHEISFTIVDDSAKEEGSKITYGKQELEQTLVVKCHVSPLKPYEVPISDGKAVENKNMYKVLTPSTYEGQINEFSTGTYDGRTFYVYRKPTVYKDILPHLEIIIIEGSHE